MRYCPECGAQCGENDLEGVRGWLLLVCIALTIFVPLQAMAHIETNLKLLPKLGSSTPYDIAYRLVRFQNYKILLISLVGFAGGALIWLRKPVGLFVARLYFVIVILSSVLELFFVQFHNLTLPLKLIILSSGWYFNALMIIGSILGVLYLYRSARVEATFSVRDSA